MSRRKTVEPPKNPVYIVYHEASWEDSDIVLGVATTPEQAEDIVRDTINNNVLEAYSVFNFKELRREPGGTYTAYYEGDSFDIECWFRVEMVELNTVSYCENTYE